MLGVVSYWGNDKFHVAEITSEMASIPPRAFRAAHPDGAAMVEKDIKAGTLAKAGEYRFIENESGTLLGYEQLSDD
jgi:hypothetical protein